MHQNDTHMWLVMLTPTFDVQILGKSRTRKKRRQKAVNATGLRSSCASKCPALGVWRGCGLNVLHGSCSFLQDSNRRCSNSSVSSSNVSGSPKLEKFQHQRSPRLHRTSAFTLPNHGPFTGFSFGKAAYNFTHKHEHWRNICKWQLCPTLDRIIGLRLVNN